MKLRTTLIFLLVPMLGLLLSISAGAVHLQDVYNQAGPGEGYDKLLQLHPDEVYTGFMAVDSQTSCALHGNGALILLDEMGTIAVPNQAALDIDGCVITGGAYGLYYDWSASSTVENCTIVENTTGIRAWGGTIIIKNCIIANNVQHGIACLEGSEPIILYNNVWNNVQLNYAAFCPT